ncbi:hypothetical protein K933_02101 [Candidatus Halobonum tyrrellensis G22]|uniref:Uncharacterized protein n=1 Tax=Candidatus Halobonum tyrrellensis G22 TaxID=1324957 RepID=V4HP87_9EURY|nr:hypothetical protein K933_02101 [Candidatus Halobonum tyrrellensis G22]
MTPTRRRREPERPPDLTTRDDRPVWIGEVTDGDLPVVLGDEVWTVPVDDVEPTAFPCAGPLPVLDTIDMERVYCFEGEPRAEAVVTSTVVVELRHRDGQWRLHGFASSDASCLSTNEKTLWERDVSETSEREELSA